MRPREYLLVVASVAACGGQPAPELIVERALEVRGCGFLQYDNEEFLATLDSGEAARDDLVRALDSGGAAAAVARLVDPPERLVRLLHDNPKPDLWQVSVHQEIVAPAFRRCAYPLGQGWQMPFRFSLQPSPEAEPMIVDLPGAWITKGPAGWRIHSAPPRAALQGTRVVSTRATVWASLLRRWVTATVDLEVDVTGPPVMTLLMPPLEGLDRSYVGPSEGFRLLELTVDGDDVISPGLTSGIDTAIDGDTLLVGGVRGRLSVRMRYQGYPPSAPGSTQLRAGEIHLSDWLPEAPLAEPHPYDLTIHAADGEHVVTGVALDDPDRDKGAQPPWRTLRGTTVRPRAPVLLFTTYARVREESIVDDGAGNRIIAAGFRARPDDTCQVLLPLMRTMSEIAPLGEVRLEMFGRSGHGQHDEGLILLGPDFSQSLCSSSSPAPTTDDVVVAHELAHVWFGGQVVNEAAGAAGWWEALAEYVATSLWPEPGRVWRQGRADAYARVTDDFAAMSQRFQVNVYVQLSYGRGALLFTALEDRVGMATMRAFLRDFIATNRGRPASWEAIVDSVGRIAGADHAAWLRTWLNRPNAPDLRLRNARVKNGRIKAELVQTAIPPWSGTVQLAFERGAEPQPNPMRTYQPGEYEKVAAAARGSVERLTLHRIDFAVAVTPIDLPLPPGAERLVLDPDYRLPRKYDPDKRAVDDGRAIRLAVAAR